MPAPLDSAWDDTIISQGNLNKTTYGQGTVNPTTWPVDRLWWRTDENIIYKNTGTETSPVWSPFNFVQTGTIIMWGGTEGGVPSGYLFCDGTAVSRTTYADLFAEISTHFGVGDGSTTFNLPDFETSSRFPRGAPNATNPGGTGGSTTHVLTTAEMPSHNHSYTAPSSSGTPRGQPGSACQDSSTGSTTGSAGSGAAHENKPPYLDVHFIIKT